MHALIAKAEKDVPQLTHRQNGPDMTAADLPVLAKHTAQTAAGKEYGAGAARSADAGLLAEMRGGPRHNGKGGAGAYATRQSISAACAAVSGTIPANKIHDVSVKEWKMGKLPIKSSVMIWIIAHICTKCKNRKKIKNHA